MFRIIYKKTTESARFEASSITRSALLVRSGSDPLFSDWRVIHGDGLQKAAGLLLFTLGISKLFPSHKERMALSGAPPVLNNILKADQVS